MMTHSPLSIDVMPPTPPYSGFSPSISTLAGICPAGDCRASSVRKVAAWQRALAVRPSVIAAVTEDYQDRLMVFLRHHDAHLLARKLLAA